MNKARAKPAQYVALGSSFATGLGLGPRAPGSPCLCMRTSGGYPQHLSRMLGYTLLDMTCSGATAQHVLKGGQFFAGAQVEGIEESTKLVTITAGGNDVDYVRDLTLLNYRRNRSVLGFILRLLWRGPKSLESRKYDALYTTLKSILLEARRRAPLAHIVVVTYPPILPPASSPMLRIDESDAALMRSIADRLAETTRRAAASSGARLVDMAALGIGHDACAALPWVNGGAPAAGAPFHPTLAGAQATALAIAKLLDGPQR